MAEPIYYTQINATKKGSSFLQIHHYTIYYVLSLFLRQGLMEPIWVGAHWKRVEDDRPACTRQVLRLWARAVLFRSVLSLPMLCTAVLQAERR